MRPARTNGLDTSRSFHAHLYVEVTGAADPGEDGLIRIRASGCPRPRFRSSHASGARRTTASSVPPPSAGDRSSGMESCPEDDRGRTTRRQARGPRGFGRRGNMAIP
jgi:hypothetical protein